MDINELMSILQYYKGEYMLKQQKQFLDYLNEIKKITDINNQDKVFEYENNIKNIELLIPFIGAFSAGKSSAINAFLGEKILPTNIDPETTYPAELVYSKDEKMLVFYKDFNTSTHNLDEFKSLSKNDNISHVRLFINNDNLKSIEPFIIVDMPGFCSTENTHTANIANYLLKGTYFIVLCPAEGTISQDILQELNNIRKYKKDYLVCINKIESVSKLDDVKLHFKETLETNLLYKKDLLLLPKNSQTELKNLFNKLNPDDIISDLFKRQLLSHHYLLQDNIEAMISAITLDKEECQRIIENIQSMKVKLNTERNRIVNYMQNSRAYEMIDQISSKVCKDLMNLVDYFAHKYLNNQNIDAEFMQKASSSFALHSKREINKLRVEIISETAQILKNISLNDCFLSPEKIENISYKIDLNINYQQNLHNEMPKDKSDLALDLLSIATTIFVPTSKIAKAALLVFTQILGFAKDKNLEKSQREYEKNMKESQLSSIKTQLANNISNLEQTIKQEYSDEILIYSNNLLKQIMDEFDKALCDFENTHENELKLKQESNTDNEKRLKDLQDYKNKLKELKHQYLIKE